jgi:hypothetical protein
MGRNAGQFNQSGGQNLGEQTYGEVWLNSILFALNQAILVCLYWIICIHPDGGLSPSLSFNSVKIFAAGWFYFALLCCNLFSFHARSIKITKRYEKLSS